MQLRTGLFSQSKRKENYQWRKKVELHLKLQVISIDLSCMKMLTKLSGDMAVLPFSIVLISSLKKAELRFFFFFFSSFQIYIYVYPFSLNFQFLFEMGFVFPGMAKRITGRNSSKRCEVMGNGALSQDSYTRFQNHKP